MVSSSTSVSTSSKSKSRSMSSRSRSESFAKPGSISWKRWNLIREIDKLLIELSVLKGGTLIKKKYSIKKSWLKIFGAPSIMYLNTEKLTSLRNILKIRINSIYDKSLLQYSKKKINEIKNFKS